MKNRVLIANRIRRILDEKEWSQQELADATGFSKSYVSLVLSAHKNLTLKTIEIFEKALGKPILKILE
jgi:transcriptional regulator with XRE-family HTH domain